MPSFAQAYLEALRHPVLLAIWIAISFIGIIAGPFETFTSMSTAARSAYWPLVSGLGILFGAFIRVSLQLWMGRLRFWQQALILAVSSSVVLTPVFVLLTRAFTAPSEAIGWERMASYVFIVSVAVSTIRFAAMLQFGDRVSAPADTCEDDAEPVAPCDEEPGSELRILGRLDPALRAPMVRMQVRDHYVEVVTEAGSESLLMRLADAIGETEGVEGLQVHRSHWVARRAIASLHRGRGKVVLRLCDGAVVPVSRTYLAQVEALGLPEAGMALAFRDAAE